MGQSGTKEVQGKPVVVVVGGGYAGVAAAQELDRNAEFNVVLIDRKEYFLHNVAALRASVQPTWAGRILVPYDKTLKHGTVIQAEVTNLTPQGVHVHGRDEPIPFDYLVVATGSSYAFPCKLAEPKKAVAAGRYERVAGIIARANSIAIVGGGPTGIELAGEIRHVHPTKDIVLIHAQAELLPGPGLPELKQKALDKLQRLNVRVLLNERLALADEVARNRRENDDIFLEGQRQLVTQSGVTVTADLVFFCTGLAVNNGSFGGLQASVDAATGRLRVNPRFQVEGHERVFAIGDCCTMERAPSAYYAGMHAQHVAKVISGLQRRRDEKAYAPAAGHTIVVPVGPDDGVSQLPLGDGKVFGRRTTRMLKSKDLFWQKYYKALNLKPGKELAGEDEDTAKVRGGNLAAALRISEAEAEQLRHAGLPVPEHELGATHT